MVTMTKAVVHRMTESKDGNQRSEGEQCGGRTNQKILSALHVFKNW
jgi:hypothetical protein